MSTNRGKDFENVIKSTLLECAGMSLDRFYDPTAGYAGVQNICDFVAYKFPFEYYFECKSILGNTLNFKADITAGQWNGLTEKSKIRGVYAGIIVWFIAHDTTAFVPISELNRLAVAGVKSLNIKDIRDDFVKHVIVPGIKKRVFFKYDGTKFIENLQKLET